VARRQVARPLILSFGRLSALRRVARALALQQATRVMIYSPGAERETPMTKLLDQALEAARNLPADAQDDIARVVLRLAGADDGPPVSLMPEEQAAIASKTAAARGEFATDAQVRAVWAKHGL
jgi:hypothetical protein